MDHQNPPPLPTLEVEDALSSFIASPRKAGGGTGSFRTNKHKRGRKEAMAAQFRDIYQRRLDEALQAAENQQRYAVEEAHKHAVARAEVDHQRALDEIREQLESAQHAAIAAHAAEADVVRANAVDQAVARTREEMREECDVKIVEMTQKTKQYFQRKMEREHMRHQADFERQLEEARSKIADESLGRLRAELEALQRKQETAAAEHHAAVAAAEEATLARAQQTHNQVIQSIQEEKEKSLQTALVQAEAERAAAVANARNQVEVAKQEALRVQAQCRIDMEELRNEHAAALRKCEVAADAQIHELREQLELQAHEAEEKLRAALAAQARELDASKAAALSDAEAVADQRFASLQEEKGAIVTMLRSEAALRRKTHNRLVELQGNIQVFCRFRPVLPMELQGGADAAASVVEFPDAETVKLSVPSASTTTPLNRTTTARFEFDKTFGPNASQADVFSAVQPLVVSALDGYNVTIFAYGQTGSGKTHTMDGTSDEPGVNRRAVEALFSSMTEREAMVTYEVHISILEVYNEELQDLLADPSSPSTPGARETDVSASPGRGSGGGSRSSTPSKLEIRKDGNQGHEIPGLSKRQVFNLAEVLTCMEQGTANRTVGRHNMNEHSSRSHLVLTLYIVGTNTQDNGVVRSKVHLIDLAGSERVSKTDATGATLKEAQNINKSLSTLGDVISAVGRKASHVPFRNSKLTYLLQDSFTRGAKVQLVVTCSPAVINAAETLTSLNFAKRCRAVELGAARRNADSAEVAKLRRQVRLLQEDLSVIASASVEDETSTSGTSPRAFSPPPKSKSQAPRPGTVARASPSASGGSTRPSSRTGNSSSSSSGNNSNSSSSSSSSHRPPPSSPSASSRPSRKGR